MSLNYRQQNTMENLLEDKATPGQVERFSWRINAHKKLANEVFPDRVEKGANRWLQDAEEWARKQDKFTLSQVISFLEDGLPEMAINQIKHLQ